MLNMGRQGNIIRTIGLHMGEGEHKLFLIFHAFVCFGALNCADRYIEL